MPLGKLFGLFLLLLSVAMSIVVAHNSTVDGYINLLSLSKSDSIHNYQIDSIDVVQSYLAKQTIAVPPIALLDSRNTLLLSNGDELNDRHLFLTNNTVEVYHNDLASFRSVYVTSLPLESGCIPWYITGSSIHDNGIFYVQYQGGCGYTEFLYDFEIGEFDEPRYVEHIVNVIATLDGNDVTVSVSEDKQELTLDTTYTGSNSFILANKISMDCAEFHKIYPLDPFEEHMVFFSVICTTSEGELRSYSVDYWYQFSPLNLTVTSLVPGQPVSDAQYLAIRSMDTVTLYDRYNLGNGVPGRHTFAGRVQNVAFHDIANLTWLSVQLDSNNLFVIDVSLLIASRGEQGVHELPNTNIDCIPGCLPLVAIENELIVVTVSKDITYSCVVFDFSTGKPEEIRRIANLLDRPFAVVFIPDPTYQPPTPFPTVVPPEFLIDLPAILGSTISIIVLALMGLMLVGLLIWYRKLGRIRYSKASSGGLSTENILMDTLDRTAEPVVIDNSGLIPPPLDTSTANPQSPDEQYRVVINPVAQPPGLDILPSEPLPTGTEIRAIPLLLTPQEGEVIPQEISQVAEVDLVEALEEANYPLQVNDESRCIAETEEGAGGNSEYRVNYMSHPTRQS